MKTITTTLLSVWLTSILMFAVGCDLNGDGSGRPKPMNVFIVLNEGDETTGDTLLEVSIRGYFLDYMKVSLDSLFREVEWQPFDTLTELSVPRRPGMVTVYAKFYSIGGDTSGVYRDRIMVDISAAITYIDVSAANDTLQPGDRITFQMGTGEYGEARVVLGDLASGLLLNPIGEGMFSRVFTVPDGFSGETINPVAQFVDRVGNRAADVRSEVRLIIKGQSFEPYLVSSLRIEGLAASEVWYKEGHVLISDANAKLHLVDVGWPQNPIWKSSYNVSGYGGGVSGNNQLLAVACGDGGVSIFSINPPSATSQVSHLILPSKAQDVQIVNDICYVACVYSGLYILDLREMRNPKILGHTEMQGYGENVLFHDDTVFVSGISGIAAIDVRDSYHPEVISELSIEGLPIGQVYWEGSLFVATARNGVVVVDVRDAKHMRIASEHPELNPSSTVAISPPYLFIGGNDHISIVNAAVPETLPLVGIVPGLWPTKGMYINYHLLYVSAENGLHIVQFLD